MAHPNRSKVFISYSRDDKSQLDRLLQMLSPLQREQPNTIWWDGVIKAGQEWRLEIQNALARAKVAVLLVSPGFLASEFILKEELPVLLRAARQEGVSILWCLVRTCNYEMTPLASFQAFPYQQTHSMRAWNSMGDWELDELLKLLAQEIDSRLRAETYMPREDELNSPMVEESPPTEISAQNNDDESGRSAEVLLEGVNNLQTIDEIGDLFVLRYRWVDAEFTYNRLLDLASPHKEGWMAWGYEKLGRVRYRKRSQGAKECWQLARSLYLRLEENEKAAEMETLIEDYQVPAID